MHGSHAPSPDHTTIPFPLESQLYLCSTFQTPSSFSAHSKKKTQFVYLSACKDYNAVWHFQYADSHFRYEMEGEVIEVGVVAPHLQVA